MKFRTKYPLIWSILEDTNKELHVEKNKSFKNSVCMITAIGMSGLWILQQQILETDNLAWYHQILAAAVPKLVANEIKQ